MENLWRGWERNERGKRGGEEKRNKRETRQEDEEFANKKPKIRPIEPFAVVAEDGCVLAGDWTPADGDVWILTADVLSGDASCCCCCCCSQTSSTYKYARIMGMNELYSLTSTSWSQHSAATFVAAFFKVGRNEGTSKVDVTFKNILHLTVKKYHYSSTHATQFWKDTVYFQTNVSLRHLCIIIGYVIISK